MKLYEIGQQRCTTTVNSQMLQPPYSVEQMFDVATYKRVGRFCAYALRLLGAMNDSPQSTGLRSALEHGGNMLNLANFGPPPLADAQFTQTRSPINHVSLRYCSC